MTENIDDLQEEVEVFIAKYQGELSIDVYDLEDDCSIHSETFNEVSLIFAKVNGFLKRTSLNVKEVESELALKIRENPEDYTDKKLTESMISNIIDGDKEVKLIRRVKSMAEEINLQISGLLNAFEHRRSMLNNEVTLWVQKLSGGVKEYKTEDMKKQLEDKGKRRKVRKAE